MADSTAIPFSIQRLLEAAHERSGGWNEWRNAPEATPLTAWKGVSNVSALNRCATVSRTRNALGDPT
jgi:hypothetical protein